MKELKAKAEAKGAKDFENKKGEILNYKNGAYLIELDEFVKLHDGKIEYKPIETCCGCQIKFCKNGNYDFTVFVNGKPMEDRITSLKKAREICKDMKKKEEYNFKHLKSFESFSSNDDKNQE